MSVLHADAAASLAPLLERNRAWAAEKLQRDPDFFRRLSLQQKPSYFWIGCSDSRVPATEIVDLDPGKMFVHRNVANLAIAGDPSFEAALAFAVDVLGVQHVIVTGHYGCGGIAAARRSPDDELGRWLAPAHALFKQHGKDAAVSDDRLCELNVLAQVARLCAHPTIVRAWRRERRPWVHGWIYSIANGLLAELCAPMAPTQLGAFAHD